MLTNTVAELLDFCPDAIVGLLLEGQALLAGGSVLRKVVGAVDSTDIDIFFTSSEVYADAIVELNKHPRITELPVQSSSFADVQGRRRKWVFRNKELDLVNLEQHVKSAAPSDVLATFDINLSQIGYDGRNVIVTQAFIDGLVQRRLVDVSRRTPDTTATRIEKYAKFLEEATRVEWRRGTTGAQ